MNLIKDKRGYLAQEVVLILVPISFLVAILSIIPMKESNQYYTLAIQNEFEEEKLNVSHKMNVSGGLYQGTSTDISFLIKNGDIIESRNIEYTGNIKYIAGDKNSIQYTTNCNIFGNELDNEDIMITYDKNLFTVE